MGRSTTAAAPASSSTYPQTSSPFPALCPNLPSPQPIGCNNPAASAEDRCDSQCESCLPSGAQLKRGCGCPRCNGIGYRGRTGVHEILTITPPLARALRGGTLQEFESAAQEAMADGTIAHRVLQLVMAGHTTIAEAMKVVNWDEA